MPLTQLHKDASRNVLNHAKQLEAVISLAQLVDDIAVLENLAKEAENRRDAAEATLFKAASSTAEVKERAAKIEAEAKSALDKLEAEATKAKASITDAKAEASSIIAKAKVKAASLEAEATSKLNTVVSGFDKAISDKAEELEAIEAKVKAASGTMADLDKRIERARAYLNKLAEA